MRLSFSRVMALILIFSLLAVVSVPLPRAPAQDALQPAAPPAAEQSPAPQSAVSWKQEEVQSLLQKIYMAAFRVTDLLTLLQPGNWKMEDAERQSFGQSLDALREQLKT